MGNDMRSPRTTVVVVALAALLVAFIGKSVRIEVVNDPAIVASEAMTIYPTSLLELVSTSDLVIDGTVVSASYNGLTMGYDQYSNLVMVPPSAGPLTPGQHPRPLSMNVIHIDLVRYDPTGMLQAGDMITIRQIGKYDPEYIRCDDYEQDLTASLGRPGDNHIYFLVRSPDMLAYSLRFGDASRLNVNGAEVQDSSCENAHILFASTDPATFLDELADTIDQVIESPPMY